MSELIRISPETKQKLDAFAPLIAIHKHVKDASYEEVVAELAELYEKVEIKRTYKVVPI